MDSSINFNINRLFSEELYKDVPFPHVLVEDLFSEKLFKYLYLKIENFLGSELNIKALNEEFIDKKNKLSVGKNPNIVYRLDRWEELGVQKSIYMELARNINLVRDKIFKFYHQSRYSEDYYLDMFFAFTLPNTSYEIHYDVPTKCWTLAYFIYPKVNAATVLYDIPRKNKFEYKWRLNSGVAFCPKDNITWHSYYNPSLEEIRVTLVTNIVRKDFL